MALSAVKVYDDARGIHIKLEIVMVICGNTEEDVILIKLYD